MLSIRKARYAGYYTGGGSGGCGARVSRRQSRAEYELGPAGHGEPPGRWMWRGQNALKRTGEITRDNDEGEAFRLVVDELKVRNPETEEKEQLGVAPQGLADVEARVIAYREAHPLATPEDVAAFRVTAMAAVQTGTTAHDFVFAPSKSWSVWHAALLRVGRTADAALVIEA